MEGLSDYDMTHLSAVVPVLNESSIIEELVDQVKSNFQLITEDFEIILVDDGSEDQTWSKIETEAKREKRVKGIKLSRNFGHHYAITAGLHNSTGEWVIVMDGDLQDRPEVIPKLHKKALEGYDIVFVSRINRPEKLHYRLIQKLFYFILNSLTGFHFDSRQANYSIINKKVVEAFRQFPESTRFYGSTITWLGFKRTYILANHGTRYLGKPSYTLKKRLKLASDIIFSFSDRPLRAAITISFLIATLSLFINFFSFSPEFEINLNESSWTMFRYVSLMFGVLFFNLAIFAVYLKNIYHEVKKRPLYIIDTFT
jgi:glycosyltransferase involved in cell wall biosynthesis